MGINGNESLERCFLASALTGQLIGSIDPGWFTNGERQDLAREIRAMIARGERPDTGALMAKFPGECALLADVASTVNPDRIGAELQDAAARRAIWNTAESVLAHINDESVLALLDRLETVNRSEVGSIDETAIYTPSWSNRPPRLPPVLTLNGERIGSPGNLTVIVAAPGAGKSALCEAIISNRIATNCDSFGLKVATNDLVAYIDTERSKEDHWDSFARCMRRAGINEGDMIAQSIVFELIATLPAAEARFRHVKRLLTTSRIGLLLIDGIGDLVVDVNDPKESGAMLAEILAIAKQRNTAILGTIHHNSQPGAEKARGHLGSEAMRRAESVLILKRDSESGQRTLTTNFEHGKVRNAIDSIESHFSWDPQFEMFISCENQVAAKKPRTVEKYEDFARQLKAVKISWSYSELVGRLAEIAGEPENEKKGKNIHAAMKKRELVFKNDSEEWEVV